LGNCNFAIFTSGKGSEGGVLGWFKIKGRNIKIERSSRRIFQSNGWDKNYVGKSNFYEVCQPTIELNGNYSGTENAFLATLVHEMCHYYTYMYGYAPKQGHGREFKDIGAYVSARSNGMFTIQRLASAEQMSEYELNDVMKAKREKRLANKKAAVTAIIVFTKSGKVKLTITSSQRLINLIENGEKDRGENVVVTNDANVIEYLFSKGFRQNLRTWRYWSLEDRPWLDELKKMLPETSGETLGISRPTQTNNTNPTMIFSIKTTNGVFETECNSFVELRQKLQQRFPQMSYETISKLMGNRANFKKMVENKNNVKSIVESVINEFMENEFGGNEVEIDPEMNLGLQSPLENE
jgi:predicted SprT family Zn-dependent metalloprotease